MRSRFAGMLSHYRYNEIEPGVMLDQDANGQVVGVEVLDFQARLAPAQKGKSSEGVTVAIPGPGEERVAFE